MKHTVRQELGGVLSFIAIIWAVFILDVIIPVDLTGWGIRPRSLTGAVGIPVAPFLHAGLQHIISNTIPLTVLLVLMAGSRAQTWATVAEIAFLGGLLLWLFGRAINSEGQQMVHVGASGLIYGLMSFLVVAGFREKRLLPLLVALLVGFLYGGTFFSGIMPALKSHVSWDGHLMGAVAGGILGYVAVWRSPKEKVAEQSWADKILEKAKAHGSGEE